MRRHAKGSSAGSTSGTGAGRALLLLAISTCSLLVLVPSALAAKTTVNTIGSPSTATAGGFFNTPAGVAVNKTGEGGVPAGTIYVADRSNNRIQRFSPTGAFVSAFGWDNVALSPVDPSFAGKKALPLDIQTHVCLNPNRIEEHGCPPTRVTSPT